MRTRADDWIRASTTCAADLASHALSTTFAVVEHGEEFATELTGGYVALVGGATSAEIGIASDSKGCQLLSQALFGLDETLPESDVIDAMGEIANILAGGVKGQMIEHYSDLTLGLPLVVRGTVISLERQDILRIGVSFGQIKAWILILNEKEEVQVATG